MPTLQTALEKALSEWGATDTTSPAPTSSAPTTERPYGFTVTTNVARATFDAILTRPGRPRAEVVADLVAQGYKKPSVQSLLVQMKRQQRIEDRDGNLYPLVETYRPVQGHKAWKRQQAQTKQTRTRKPRDAEPIKAVAEPAKPLPTFDAQQFVENLPLGQARQVYDALRKIFGG